MKYIKTYLKISIAGIIIACIYHYILGAYFNMSWPYNSFLFSPKFKFLDFFQTTAFGQYAFQGLNPFKTGVINNYMPLMNWMVVPFSLGNPIIRFIIFVVIIIVTFFIYFYKSIYKLNEFNRKDALEYAFFLIISSYPVITLIDRGNFEYLIFLLIALFIYFYKKQNYYLASFMLTLATSLKPFSIVFIVLFLSDKKYRELFCYIISTITISFISILILPGGLISNFNIWMSEMNQYVLYYVDLNMGSYYNHSLFSPLHAINWVFYVYTFSQIRKIYFSIAVIIFIIISVHIIEREKSFSRKVFLLILCMIGLPFVSSDYTLINLYIPIILFIEEMQNRKDTKYTKLIIILSAVLMIPKNYTYPLMSYRYGLSIIVNPFIILALFIVIIFQSKEQQTGSIVKE